jgi:hypothetical protein
MQHYEIRMETPKSNWDVVPTEVVVFEERLEAALEAPLPGRRRAG